MGVLVLSGAALAELEVKPYGAAQYRLRLQHDSYSYENNNARENFSTLDYSNRMCLRVGLRAKWDDQFSMQFQVGNDWGEAENVEWSSNRNGGRLYMHLAFFRYNPGSYFLEAGIVPINSNGALDFFHSSLHIANSSNTAQPGDYSRAIFNGWGDQNNSLAGIKLGVPVVKEGVKVGAELTQSVIQARTQGSSTFKEAAPAKLKTPAGNPASIMTVLQIPVDAGNFKITPEAAVIFNRDVNRMAGTGKDAEVSNEMAFGAAGSYKVNSGVSLTFRGGYAMYNNENTPRRTDIPAAGDVPASVRLDTLEMSSFIVGAGTTIKAGPGNLQFAVDYQQTENGKIKDSDISYLYTDLRYAMRIHPRVTVTPRYRTYTTMNNVAKDSGALETRFNNRFEAIIEGSF